MRMTEIVKDLKLTGCEQITLDTCTLDASSTANTLAVSNDIISLGSKVSIAAESLGNVRIGPTDITVRADDTMSGERKNCAR
jgi:3D (Asp-Asp-Asp) domain-containing protein